MTLVEVVAVTLLLFGVGLNLIGGIGLNRFPDVFSRMHAATKPVTLGLACVLVATAILKGDPASAVKLLLAASLQFVSAPIAAHIVGRAAYRSGVERAPDTIVDEFVRDPAAD